MTIAACPFNRSYLSIWNPSQYSTRNITKSWQLFTSTYLFTIVLQYRYPIHHYIYIYVYFSFHFFFLSYVQFLLLLFIYQFAHHHSSFSYSFLSSLDTHSNHSHLSKPHRHYRTGTALAGNVLLPIRNDLIKKYKGRDTGTGILKFFYVRPPTGTRATRYKYCLERFNVYLKTEYNCGEALRSIYLIL